MTPSQLRQKYLDFFVSRAHKLVDSSPVVPEHDQTLLFANAGMNQFKDLLLGHEVRDYTRAVSVQKCVRAGGKHNDLDDVGKDARHLTFFEMLGNWSFGDYYKVDTIKWAWEFVTTELNLSTDRLYVTVHHTDDESLAIWRDDVGVDPDRILKLGDKDNFWAMGPTGPCGPCTEIHYDMRPEDGPFSLEEGYDDDRVVEIWNLVFMESNRQEDGTMIPLPMQSVDTGMGLDRVAMALAGRHNVFHTSLFTPIFIKALDLLGEDASGWETEQWDSFYDRKTFEHFAVIGDHIRTVLFALCDGAKFANTGRGYVLRRILRRAVLNGRELGFKEPFMHQVADAVIEHYGEVYPELQNVGEKAASLIKLEEEHFFKNLERGIALFENIAEQARQEGNRPLTSEEVFDLYNTNGFPPDLTQIMAERNHLTVDLSRWDELMEQQRMYSKGKDVYANAAGVGDWTTIEQGDADNFVGYTQLSATTTIRKYRSLDDNRIELTLSTTPFYAESGGQVGDQGTLRSSDGELVLRVIDVQKAPLGFIHVAQIVEGDINQVDWSQSFEAQVDEQQRLLTMCNHTATHLLHAALREHISDEIVQAGSLVSPSKLRFDFTYGASLDASQLRLLEDQINEKIRQSHDVTIHQEVERDVAVEQMGAMAIFGEKYGSSVRVVDIPGESVELCGGTHVQNTNQINLFRITSESSVAAGIRRIEAVTNEAAYGAFQSDRENVAQVAQSLKTKPTGLLERVNALNEERLELERQLRKLNQRLALLEVDNIVEEASVIEDIKVIAQHVNVDTREQLLAYADRLREKLGKGIVLLGSEIEGKAALLCLVTEDTFKTHKLKAGDLINDVASHVNGRGGGRPTLAQAGGGNPAGIPNAVGAFEQAVRSRLN